MVSSDPSLEKADPDYQDTVSSFIDLIQSIPDIVHPSTTMSPPRHAKTEAESSGITPLHRASQLGRESVAQALLESGADVNARTAKGETALHHAAMYSSTFGHGEEVTGLIRLLIRSGADIHAETTPEKCSPLHLAALVGDALSVSVLIAAGADVHRKDAQGNLPLHKACERVVSPEAQRARTVRLLLSNGACSNTTNCDGQTPLHVLLQQKDDSVDLDVVRVLLDHKADPNLPVPSGLAPVLLAMENHLYNLAQLLVEKGADPNVQARDGKTPLHYACRAAQASLFSLIWSHGGDPTILDSNGFTPMRYAVESGIEDVVRACVSSGVSTWQVTSPPTDVSTVLSVNEVMTASSRLTSPFLYAFCRSNVAILTILFSCGGFSFAELHNLKKICDAADLELLTPSQKEAVHFIHEVSQSTPSLQSLCRWKISHLIGCRPDRKSRARGLGLPTVLRGSVQFVDGV